MTAQWVADRPAPAASLPVEVPMASNSAEDRWDAVIVGSGPVGSGYARALLDSAPGARILMLEAGPAATAQPGLHLANLADAALRATAQRACQGPRQEWDDLRAASAIAHNAPVAERGRALARRPGLFSPAARAFGLPAAQAAANVGGMGIHWLGACPRPRGSERPTMIEASRLDAALGRAESLLGVRGDQFTDSAFARYLEAALNDPGSPFAAGPAARPMPLTARMRDGAVERLGTEHLMDRLMRNRRFRLRDRTVCLRVLREHGRVVGVLARDQATTRNFLVRARHVVLACDALRTPQLLFASGIRPPALGRHLNEHSQVSVVAEIDHRGAIPPADLFGAPLGQDAEPGAVRPSGITWLPFDAEARPFHGMLARIDPTSYAGSVTPGRGLLSVHLFIPQQVRWENRVEFSQTELDWVGLPQLTIRHELSGHDSARVAAALACSRTLADLVGRPAPGERPWVLPSGSSMHFQGTVRMGAHDDGLSVCDRTGEVWSAPGVFVAGTGVIPTETACNPTLLSVALAVLSAQELGARLRAAAAVAPPFEHPA